MGWETVSCVCHVVWLAGRGVPGNESARVQRRDLGSERNEECLYLLSTVYGCIAHAAQGLDVALVAIGLVRAHPDMDRRSHGGHPTIALLFERVSKGVAGAQDGE